MNGDGLISLYEYFLVVCLIQANRDDIKTWFRSQPEIKEEFITPELLKGFYNNLLKNSRIKLTITKMPDPRKVQLSKSEYESTLQELIDGIFKKYPNQKLPLKNFLAMREDLLKEILQYEYNTFP